MITRSRWLPAGMLKRVLTAVVLIPAFVWLVARGPGWLFVLVVLAVSAAALWELLSLFEGAGQVTYWRLGLVLGTGVTASFAVARDLLLPVMALTAATGVLLSAPLWRSQRPTTEPAVLTLFGLMYVSWLLGHGLALWRLPDGSELLLFLAAVTWAGESAAYVVGSTLGRHKLAPAISPNKTVEGAAAQWITSVVAAPAFAAWLLPDWPAGRAIVAGSLLGVVGQLGDLAESVIKRSVGVKDASGLIPGHGGVLDRVDGLLFNVPLLYYYVAWGGGA